MLLEKQIEILEEVFLFEGCDFDLVLPILEKADSGYYDKNDYIYSATRFKHAMGIILSGSAVVKKGHLVVLKDISIGECFGVASLFNSSKKYVSTIIAQRSTTVLYLTNLQLAEIFDACPRAAINYICFLSERICFLNQKLDSFTAPSSESRIALFLIDELRSDSTVNVPTGYAALARFLGMGRASLYRCLDELAARGILTREEKCITILDKSKLTSLTPTQEIF